MTPTPSPQTEIPCPGETGSTITVPPGATVPEILALGIGGSEMTVNSGGLSFLDPNERYYRLMTRALRRQDKTVDDWTTHIGFDEQAEILVTAFEIDGADASAFLETAIEMILAGFPNRRHDRETGEVGGKPVTNIRPARAQGRVFHFYTSDDVVWIVMGPESFSSEFLGALP